MSQWGRIKPLSQARLRWGAALVWMLAIAGLTLFWGLGEIGLIDETEPLFVEAARQMLRTGNWITPFFDGETRFDKPPLIYWLMVLCFKLFGVSEWAARIPSAISAVLIVLFSFYTLKQYPSPLAPSRRSAPPAPQRAWLAAWLGATMLMLNLNTYFWGRTGYSDMLLTTCMGGALLAFFLGYAQPNQVASQRRWYGLFYLLTALAVLTKGPIALLLPALIIGGFGFYLGNLQQIVREMQLLWGTFMILVLALPWYILVTLANGEAFIDSFFGYHNLVRFASVVNQHSGPWYFHFLVVLAGFLPWSAYLPSAIMQVKPWQRNQWQQRSRSEQLGLYALIWFGVILGFFTISVTKYFSYTLPLMPAAAILVGLLWTDDILGSPTAQRWNLSRWFNAGLCGILAWALFSCVEWLTHDPWMPNLGEKIAAAHLPMTGGIVWMIAAGAIILCILWRSNVLVLVNVIAFVVFIATVLHPAIAIVDQERQLPLRELAKTAVAGQSPQEELIMIGFRKPSLVFYTQQHVAYLEEPQQLTPYLQRSTAPGQWILTTPELLEQTAVPPRQYETIQQSGVYTLVHLRRNS